MLRTRFSDGALSFAAVTPVVWASLSVFFGHPPLHVAVGRNLNLCEALPRAGEFTAGFRMRLRALYLAELGECLPP
jgi:hypothetical protein